MSINLSLLKKIRCRFLDRSTGMPVPGVIVSLSVAVGEPPKLALLPIATLCTDATGYLSFDLKPVIELGLGTAASGLLISAPKYGLTHYDLIAALAAPPQEGPKNTKDVVGGSQAASTIGKMMLSAETSAGARQFLSSLVFPIYLATPLQDKNGSESAACQPARLPSIQSPDVCDYKVSPFSFVNPAALKLGDDRCEILLPSSLPIQQVRFTKVIVRREEPSTDGDGFPNSDTSLNHEVQVLEPLKSLTPVIKFGEILNFRQDWYSLGHSLGEIKYSLPLAPGESTQLAVIEWAREDLASRTDKIHTAEFLDHDARRDRAIEETVDAALREEQGGNSHFGGTSGTATGSQYVTWTGNHAFGGGISYSYGKRELEAESLQDLHDRVRQASSFIHSLNSTVIVQASQTEKNTLQTRRVANHNHCHALTIQYYEVVRHYRMSTAFTGRQKAVLIPFAPFAFTLEKGWELALRFRTILEQTLLDSSLIRCFDALIRLKVAPPSVYDAPPPTKPVSPTPPMITELEKALEINGSKGRGLESGIVVRKGDNIKMAASGLLAVSGGTGHGSGGVGVGGDGTLAPQGGNYPFIAPGLLSFSLIYKIGLTDAWRQGSATIEFTADKDGEIIFGVNNMSNGFADYGRPGAEFWSVALKYPSHKNDLPTVTDPTKADAANSNPYRKSVDELCSARLITHLKANQGFYNAAVWMLMDAVERRLYLEQALQDRPDILAGMDDRPVAISGNYVAFQYNGPLAQWSDSREDDPQVPCEDIVTLPTRGLFAEAQMGHCNSCEQRDVTRMWDWTEMTAETPPEISAITPGPKGSAPAIPQGQLPANVIQITQPQPAPDPMGLANALSVLKTPEIFRDMAGLDEVTQLLGELVRAAGDTNTKALALQAKEKVEQARASLGSGSTAPNQTPAERYDNLQVAREVARSADELGLNDQQKSNLSQDILGGSGRFGQFVRDSILGAVPSLSVPGIRWCCQLGINDAMELTDVVDHKYGATGTSNCGYIYTEKAGLLDIGHIRDHIDLTRYVYDSILAGKMTIPCREGTASLLQSPTDPIATAQAISYVDSWSHELRSFGGLQDFSAFAPEDLPSNYLGTYIGAQALVMAGKSGSFDAIVDTLLAGLLASLGALSKTDTDKIIASLEKKWWEYAVGIPPVKLLRRNFEGTPWFAATAFDKPPAPAYINAANMTPLFAGFDYTSDPLADKSIAKLASFPAITASMRAPFKAAGTDQP